MAAVALWLGRRALTDFSRHGVGWLRKKSSSVAKAAPKVKGS